MGSVTRTLLAALAVAAALPASALAEVPRNADWTEDYIETEGQPTLHVDVLKPKGTPENAKLPAIVSVGPYFAHSGSTPDNPDPLNDGPTLRWRDLIEDGKVFERGYALIQVDLRGFGASQGCNDFGGTGEQTDVRRAVEWAAAQPWSTGKVALYGKSYDAWTGVMGLSEKPAGLAAAIIQSPIIDGYRTLYMNGVHYDYGWYGTPALYQSIDALPPTPFDSPEYIAGSALGLNPACYAQNIALQNATMDRDTDFWRERDLPRARGADIPVLWSHGFNDANTKPDNVLDVWSTLKGPKRAWFGQYAHDRGNEDEKTGHKGFFDDVFTFLDRYVKGDRAAKPGAEPQVEVAEGDGRWRYEEQWPPADVSGRDMGVRPGTFTDDPASGSETWSITPPLPHEARLAGPARLAARVTSTVTSSDGVPRAHLIAQLWDIGPGGEAQLITRGAHVIKGPSDISFELYPNDFTLRPGHRLGLRLTADDVDWFTPPYSGQTVNVLGGALKLPFLAYRRDGFIDQAVTPSIEDRPTRTLDRETIDASATALEVPPALRPRPAGTKQGAAQAPKARPANRLRVRAKRRGRRLKVTIRGAGAERVRVLLRRNGRIASRRTVRARRGVARVTFRLTRRGTYRVQAKLLGPVRLGGRSRAVRVR